MGDRPSGAVTFLFTDVEGSTRRWEEDPGAMRDALAAHDDALGAAIVSNDGWLFKHTGDGVCAAFESPIAAVHAAVEAQRSLGLPVRMGLATGEAQLRGDDYFGPPLNLAARVMSAGNGGQILLAGVTADLVDGVDLVDLGERRLKDLSAPQRIVQVAADGLGSEFPPLVTLDEVPGNLPVQVTSFLGRVDDVAAVTSALRSSRLVTLSGVGGVGKTRLGLQVAADLSNEFPEGVWFVGLAEIGDPDAVPSAVATELGVTPRADVGVIGAVAETFGHQRALLVLDNCEHVLDIVADLVEAILAAGPVVKILTTSRESLRVSGEHVWSVPSLDTRTGFESDAVALFVERAVAVDHSFSVDSPESSEAIVEVCSRLDGIALAIELAAARTVAMSLVDIRDRLDKRFRLLSGSRRGLERHQTLRQAVQWSYELLTDDERCVLDACSVFAGGFDVPGVLAVLGDDGLDEFDVLDVLESLVRKSLVGLERTGEATRYTLLETIRQFGEEQLAATGTAEETRDRHAAHFAACVQHWLLRYPTPESPAALAWYETESANLRVAFRWALANDDFDTAATVVGKVFVMAFAAGSMEVVEWCEELLPVAIATRHRLLKHLYAGASFCAYTGRPEQGFDYAVTGRALPVGDFERVVDESEVAGLVGSYLFTGRTDELIELTRANLDNPHDTLGAWDITHVWILAATGRFDEAIELADGMLERARARGHGGQLSFAYDAYGRAFSNADPPKAIDAFHRAVELARETNSRMYEVVWTRDLAGLEARVGEPASAAKSLEATIGGFVRRGERANLAVAIGYSAILLGRLGQEAEAAELYGAATRDESALNSIPELHSTAMGLREALGPDAFDEAVERGRALTAAEMIAVSRERLRGVAAPVRQ